MRTVFRRLGAVLATIVVSLAMFAAPAHAASVGCGSVCDGKSPTSFGVCIVYGGGGVCGPCGNDAQTMSSFWAANDTVWVELRYSPRCRTAWAKTSAINNDSFGVGVESRYLDGTTRRYEMKPYGQQYSNMVNDKGLIAAALLTYGWATIQYTSWY